MSINNEDHALLLSCLSAKEFRTLRTVVNFCRYTKIATIEEKSKEALLRKVYANLINELSEKMPDGLAIIELADAEKTKRGL